MCSLPWQCLPDVTKHPLTAPYAGVSFSGRVIQKTHRFSERLFAQYGLANLLEVLLSFVTCSSKQFLALCVVLWTLGTAAFLHLTWQNWILYLCSSLECNSSFLKTIFFFLQRLCYCLSLPASFYPSSPSWYAPGLWFQYHDPKQIHVKCTGAAELSCQQCPVQGKAPGDCAQRHGMATIQHPSSQPAGQHPSWHRLDASSCPAAANDAGEGKATRHGPSELGRYGASFLPGIRVFILNQRLAKWQHLRPHYFGFSTGDDFSC